MRKFLLAAALMAAPGLSAEVPDGFTHHRAALSGALTSSDAYLLEMSYHYMVCPFFGAGGSFGYWANYFVDGYASGSGWHIDGEYEEPSNLYLRPSVILKSPSLRIRAVALGAFAEPGVMLCIPYEKVGIAKTSGYLTTGYAYPSTTRGQWCAVDARLGVSADVGPCGITLSYLVSNLDIYSQRRSIVYSGIPFSRFYPSKPLMQGVNLTLSYNF